MARYTEEQRAAAVADVLAGMSYRKAAEKHGTTAPTVHHWVEVSLVTAIRNGKSADLDSRMETVQLNLYRYVESVLDATNNADYLKGQDASDIAILIGVSLDKAERITAQRVRLAEYAQQGLKLPAPVLDLPGVSSAST